MELFDEDPNPTPRLSALTEYERSFAREYPHFVRFFERVGQEWIYVREKGGRMILEYIFDTDYSHKKIPEINAYLAGVNSEPVPLPRRTEEAAQIMAMQPIRQRSSPDNSNYIAKNYPTFSCYFTSYYACICEDCDEATWYEFRYGMFKFSVPLSVIAEVDRILWEREREPIMGVLRHLPLPIAWAVRDELVIDDGNYRELPYFCEPSRQ
jgi:hypothetical protein